MSRGYNGLARANDGWSAVEAGDLAGFVDPQRRVASARVMLLATTVLLALGIPVKMAGIALMGDLLPASEAWTLVFDVANGLGAGLVSLMFLGTVPFFLRAQRQLQRNLLAFGLVRTEPGVTWSTLAWFVPFANLIVPYHAFRELSVATGGATPRISRQVVGRWWLFYLSGCLILNLSARLDDWLRGPTGWVFAQGVSILFATLLASAGVLAIAMLRRLASQQRRAAVRIVRLGASWPAVVGSTEEMAERLRAGRGQHSTIVE